MLFCFDKSSKLAGLELSDQVVDEVSGFGRRKGFSKMDLRVFDERSAISSLWPCHFDVVISSHVLEHISQPELALRDLLTILKHGGLAILVVPINELPGEDLNHFYFFTTESLGDLARSEGLEVERSVECDCLWDMLSPLAYRLQRKGSPFLKLVSFAINGVTSVLPLLVLEWIDAILLKCGYKPRQVFLVARKR